MLSILSHLYRSESYCVIGNLDKGIDSELKVIKFYEISNLSFSPTYLTGLDRGLLVFVFITGGNY